MKRRAFLSSVLAGTAATAVRLRDTLATPGAMDVHSLRCEYATDPLGIDASSPRLSWMLASPKRSELQTAYQILVGSSKIKLDAGEGDIWNTGKVASSQSTQILYQGRTLLSQQRCYWKVRVWDREGQVSPYSEPARWEMGLLSPNDWKARWIGFTPGWAGRALYFRKDIQLQKPLQRARAYVAGLGYYELHVNGKRVGDRVLDPAWTDFSKRVLYSTYDLGAFLRTGPNTVGAIVGNGWYGMPRLLLHIEVTYNDATQGQFYTHGGSLDGGGWRVTSGPILSNSIYDGEVYDARLENTGWNDPDHAVSDVTDRREGWVPSHQVESPGGKLLSQKVDPIKIVDVLHSVKITEPKPGIFVYDFGQNAAGWAGLRVKGEAGQKVTLRFSENLASDGTVNQENLIKAGATDVYVLRGGEEETWEPKFTYHGFRYVQVEGFPGEPLRENLLMKVVRTSVEPNGVFESSNELINKIHRMIWWTEASNLHGVPTDCPQRSERMGWLNDLTVRAEEAIYNFNVSRFFTKFLDDIGDTQAEDGSITDTAPFKYGHRPADPVDASYVLLAWFLYLHYGDTRAIADHFSGFKAWTEFLARNTKNGIVTYGYWGDWSPPSAYSVEGTPVSKTTPRRLMSTGYLYYCSWLVSKMAKILGRENDSAKYGALAQATAAAFNHEYFNAQVGAYGNNDESADSFALFLGLVPEQQVPRVVENLVANVNAAGKHLTTGNLCTKYVLEALSTHGRQDLAYEIVTQKTYPSWGFMLANGATTLWERWEDLAGAGMNSHNHPMMGSVDAWFYKYLAGINAEPEAAGFRKVVIRPLPVGDLTWVRAEYTSMYGKIRSAWRKEDTRFRLDVSVPVNTTASIHIPAREVRQVTEGGKAATSVPGVRLLGQQNGAAVFEVGSNDYEFAVAL